MTLLITSAGKSFDEKEGSVSIDLIQQFFRWNSAMSVYDFDQSEDGNLDYGDLNDGIDPDLD